MPVREERISLPNHDLSLAIRSWGPVDAASQTPILALHGWLDNAASFDPLAAHASEFPFQALDFAGHGASDHLPGSGTYSILAYISHAFALADALGWEEFHVLAHSLGACVASLMAAIYPERIRSLLLIEALGPLSVGSDRLPELYGIHLSRLQALKQKTLPSYASQAEAALTRHRRSNVTLEAAQVLASRGTQQLSDGTWTWTTDPRLTVPSAHPFSEDQVDAFLSRISCPTTLILAAEGGPYDPQIIQRRQTLVAGLRTLKLPGSHHLHMEHPALVAEALRAHFSACR